LTFAAYESFIEVSGNFDLSCAKKTITQHRFSANPEPATKLTELKKLLSKLPEANKKTFHLVISHCSKITVHSQANKVCPILPKIITCLIFTDERCKPWHGALTNHVVLERTKRSDNGRRYGESNYDHCLYN